MVMHSVLITNESGAVLFGRYFDDVLQSSAISDSVTHDREHAMHWWEEEVRLQTQDLWYNAGAAVQVARAAGEDDYDELTLADVLASLSTVIIALCDEAKGGKPSESCLLMGDTYGK
eukprot:7840-Heterococcus_DN1.PRE.1